MATEIKNFPKKKVRMGNSHKVSKRVWRRWNTAQQFMFNGTFEQVWTCLKGKFFLHPRTEQNRITDDERKTIAWNAAWLAADTAKPLGM